MKGKPHKYLQKSIPGPGNSKCREPETKRVPSALGTARICVTRSGRDSGRVTGYEVREVRGG